MQKENDTKNSHAGQIEAPAKPRNGSQAEQDHAPAKTGKRKTRLYNVKEVGSHFDKLRDSDMRPLGATVHALRDRLSACLADGYSITDIVEMLQQAGIDGTDRQLRYALDRAGIHRRQVRRGRTAAVRRQVAQAGSDSVAAESDVGDPEIAQKTAGDAMNAIQDGETQGLFSSDMDAIQNGKEHGAGDPHASASSAGWNAQAGGAVDAPVSDNEDVDDVQSNRPVLAFGQSGSAPDDDDLV